MVVVHTQEYLIPNIRVSGHYAIPLYYFSSVGYISTSELLTLSRTLNGGLKERGNERLALHSHSWFLNSLYLSLYSDYSSCGPHVTHTPLTVAKRDSSGGGLPMTEPSPRSSACLLFAENL